MFDVVGLAPVDQPTEPVGEDLHFRVSSAARIRRVCAARGGRTSSARRRSPRRARQAPCPAGRGCRPPARPPRCRSAARCRRACGSASSTSAHCRASRCGSRPCATSAGAVVADRQVGKAVLPRARAIASMPAVPSLQLVCACRSPARSRARSAPAGRPQRRLDLAAVLAQLRRDPRQAQRLVDLLLGGAATVLRPANSPYSFSFSPRSMASVRSGCCAPSSR